MGECEACGGNGYFDPRHPDDCCCGGSMRTAETCADCNGTGKAPSSPADSLPPAVGTRVGGQAECQSCGAPIGFGRYCRECISEEDT